MTIKEASTKICPFIQGYKQKLDPNGIEYRYCNTTCINKECMAWVATKTKCVNKICASNYITYLTEELPHEIIEDGIAYYLSEDGKNYYSEDCDLGELAEGYCARLSK